MISMPTHILPHQYPPAIQNSSTFVSSLPTSMEPDQLNASNSYCLILRDLFFRLVVTFQIESSLSMEIIGFWLWLQGKGQAGFLLCIESCDDNLFRVIASAAKDFVEILHFEHYGDIEEISLEEPIENRAPLYAHVTFYTQMTLFRVLDGSRRVKFMTRGKHLWARQFVPKKKKVKHDELNQIA
uniref:Uncharacterized protein n=1 Tax=Avena sativa TaxID=4498 RepID=A0ACD5TZ57_AVESA